MKNNKMNLSYSKITTLQSCPRRFYYQYIAKLDEEPQVVNYGNLGSRAHLVLEDFYKHVNIESNDIEKEFNKLLAKLYHKNFKGVNDPKGSFAIGVKNFCVREITRFNELEDKSLFQPRYVELPLETEIAGEYFRGRLDCVYINPDGTLKPTDWKFTNSNAVKEPQEVQATLYIIMLEQQLNIYCTDYFFHFLKHGMGPTGRGFEKVVHVDNDLKLKVENIILDSVDTIEKGEYEATSFGSYFCSHFCPYYSACLEEKMGWGIDD